MFTHRLSSWGRFLVAPVVLLLSLSLLAGCGGPSFEEAQSSNSGLLIEQVMPEDAWFFMSFSTLEDDQRAHWEEHKSRFGDPEKEEGFWSQKIIEEIDRDLASVNLSYLDDIQPIFGDQGMRFGFSVSDDGAGTPITHFALTLHQPSQAQDLLDQFEAEGDLLKVVRDDFEIYHGLDDDGQLSVSSDGSTTYFSLWEDLLLVSDNQDELINMLNLGRSEGAGSLWTNELYQDSIEDLAPDHLFLVYIEMIELNTRLAAMEGVDASENPFNTPFFNEANKYYATEALTMSAIEDGFEFDAVVLGNREALEADDTTLDRFGAKKHYLSKDMPSEGLLMYGEAFNFAEALEEVMAPLMAEMEGNPFSPFAMIKNFLGIEWSDVKPFFMEGASMAIHQQEGVLPGFTFMIDVSEDVDGARSVMDDLGSQIGTWSSLISLSDPAIAEALSQVSVGELESLRFDIDGYLSDDIAATLSDELRSELEGLEFVLVYGVEDDRLLISTYDGWGDSRSSALSKDGLFKESVKAIGSMNEGLFYVDFDEVHAYVSAVQTLFRVIDEQAEVAQDDAPVIVSEDGGDSSESLISAEASADSELEEFIEDEFFSEPVNWDHWLGPLKSLAFSSEFKAYAMYSHGVILLD